MRVLLIIVYLLLTMVANAADLFAESHQHEHQAEILSLDHGKKWAVDAPLRQGMGNIRASAIRTLALPREEGLPQLAKTIAEESDRIIRECRLPSAADATLHTFLAKLLEHGPKLVAASSTDERNQSLMVIVEVLNHYGHYFDHPDWQDIR
ncbi:MAG: hypothetical protein HQM06_11620 [Magnetococcales bacterium]|nr:hypothetical protein [Magnetococcales bacterium]